MSDSELKKIFIVGFPRSGSTWLMWLLVNHPEIAALSQSGLFFDLKRLEDRWPVDDSGGANVIGERIEGDVQDVESGPRRLDVGRVFPKDLFYGYCRVVCEGIFNCVASTKPDVRAVVEQTPEHFEYLELIRHIFPDAYILHIVRDPRAVFASNRNARMTWANPTAFYSDPVQFAHDWRSAIEHVHARATGNYLEINYEALLTDGPETLQRIHEWIGMKSSPEMCASAFEKSTLGELRKKGGMSKGFFRKGQADGWQEELSRSQVRVLEYMLGELMENQGYARTTRPGAGAPLGMRVRDSVAAVFRGMLRTLLRGVGGVESPVVRGTRRFLKTTRDMLKHSS